MNTRGAILEGLRKRKQINEVSIRSLRYLIANADPEKKENSKNAVYYKGGELYWYSIDGSKDVLFKRKDGSTFKQGDSVNSVGAVDADCGDNIKDWIKRGNVTKKQPEIEKHLYSLFKERFTGLVGIDTFEKLKIKGLSKHVVFRAMSKGINADDIKNTLTNPDKVEDGSDLGVRDYRKTINGKEISIPVNSKGNIITAMYIEDEHREVSRVKKITNFIDMLNDEQKQFIASKLGINESVIGESAKKIGAMCLGILSEEADKGDDYDPERLYPAEDIYEAYKCFEKNQKM